MPDPTPAEIEAGEQAILALMAEHHGAPQVYRTIVDRVLRAVLPDHDARIRAQVAEEIPRWVHGYTLTRSHYGLCLTCDWCDWRRWPELRAGVDLEDLHTAARDHDRVCRRAHATPPEETDTDG